MNRLLHGGIACTYTIIVNQSHAFFLLTRPFALSQPLWKLRCPFAKTLLHQAIKTVSHSMIECPALWHQCLMIYKTPIIFCFALDMVFLAWRLLDSNLASDCDESAPVFSSKSGASAAWEGKFNGWDIAKILIGPGPKRFENNHKSLGIFTICSFVINKSLPQYSDN